jgi:hypothetical protein
MGVSRLAENEHSRTGLPDSRRAKHADVQMPESARSDWSLRLSVHAF